MKLQILVPQHKETEEEVKPLLDSIMVQQNVELESDVGVIICNDCSDVKLSKEFLDSYPFDIKYIENKEHLGVSATRNACLDKAKAEYVMFCDADDMFMNVCGLYILFREMAIGEFDALVSNFVEETRHPESHEVLYVNHEIDSTFVHGKVYRRAFLKNQKIRFKDELTIHEDSYFNCLAQKMAREVKYCPTPFYLWRWRDASVCRHDPKYILKTYNNMLDSSTALAHEFIRRKKKEHAQFYCVAMTYDAYFTMNKQEWIDQENKEYRDATELRFKKYFEEFEDLFNSIDEKEKNQIIVSIKNRMFGEGLMMESITFNDWIKNIKALKE